jgi:triosephosphate isomerase
MSKRKPIIAGNWKMNNLVSDSKKLTKELKSKLEDASKDSLPEIVLCPPFTSLVTTGEEIGHGGKMRLGAQTVDWRDSGAYTGEVSPLMLKDLCVEYVIIGHSERRMYFGESDERVNNKVKAVLNHNMIPIICCGESLEQREQGVTDSHVESQIKAALKEVSNSDIEKLVFAYEPIWAIGTGKTCDSQEANRVIKLIRSVVASLSSKEIAEKVRILYGGSVKPSTIDEQMAQSDIDGALVGGASLKSVDFYGIIKGACQKSCGCK